MKTGVLSHCVHVKGFLGRVVFRSGIGKYALIKKKSKGMKARGDKLGMRRVQQECWGRGNG